MHIAHQWGIVRQRRVGIIGSYRALGIEKMAKIKYCKKIMTFIVTKDIHLILSLMLFERFLSFQK
jgi:hypothetical protein